MGGSVEVELALLSFAVDRILVNDLDVIVWSIGVGRHRGIVEARGRLYEAAPRPRRRGSIKSYADTEEARVQC
jgi:hypothetical protein